MSRPFLTCSIVWSDIDLLELSAEFQYDGWAGHESGYITRDELASFTHALKGVAEGASSAELHAGQDNISYVRLRLFEYGMARHLGMHIHLGRADDHIWNHPSPGAAIRISVPIERGQLATFASSLAAAGERESGAATLELPHDWS
jgi:hypothetical protein